MVTIPVTYPIIIYLSTNNSETKNNLNCEKNIIRIETPKKSISEKLDKLICDVSKCPFLATVFTL